MSEKKRKALAATRSQGLDSLRLGDGGVCESEMKRTGHTGTNNLGSCHVDASGSASAPSIVAR